MKKILIISAVVFAVTLAGCASQACQAQILSGRTVASLDSTKALDLSGGKNLKIILGSSLNRVTTNDGTVALNRKNGTLEIMPEEKQAMAKTVVVEAKQLEKLNIADFSVVTVKFNRPQTANMNFTNIDRVLISGQGVIPSLSVNNVNQFRMSGKVDVNSLELSGKGSFNAKNLTSKQLLLNKSGSNIAIVRGAATIENIEQNGSGSLDLFWLNSNKTVIQGYGTSTIKLAGYTKHLIVTLENSAKLEAPFLRSDTIHITTHDQANASIYAINNLFASTFGPSTIKYFGNPKYVYTNNGGQGIILPGDLGFR